MSRNSLSDGPPLSWRRRLIVLGVGCMAMSDLWPFEGRVVSPQGDPVADALVSIVGRPGTARTDRDGRFVWQPDPAVPFEILVVLPGGRSLPALRVESFPPAGTPVRVEAPAAGFQPITVKIEAAPHILAPPAAGATLLTHDDLEQRRPSRLADALENIPGVSRLDGAADAVPSIRGMARGRTLILIDDARVTTERRAGASATYLDPFFLESVEVSRGPGSVAYGSDALGGVIHARTRMVEAGSPARLRFSGTAGAGIPEASGGLEFSQGLKEGGFLLQARAREQGDYSSPDGEIPHSSVGDRGLLMRLQHEVGAGRLSVGLQQDNVRDLEQPTTNPTQRITRPDEDSRRFTASYELDPLPGAVLAGVTAYAGNYRLVTRQEITGATPPLRLVASDVSASDLGLRAHASFPVSAARVEGGLDLNGRTNLEARVSDSAGPDQRAIQDAARWDAGLYATTDVPLSARWSAAGGVRYDLVTSRARAALAPAGSTSNGAWSGFASATAGPYSGWSVTGQVSRGFRDPSLSDRYFIGPSGRGIVTGNPDLDPERSLQYDLAVRFGVRGVRAAVYAYDYRIEDLIERFRTGTNTAGQDLFEFRNADRGTWRGVELELTGETRWGLAIELGAQAARGESSREIPLDDVPGRNATLVLRQKVGSAASVLARAALFARDDRPGPTEATTPAYATLDIGGGWNLRPAVELRLLVRDLFDRAYPAGPDARAPMAPGRSAVLTIVATVGG